ncbi:hypothetical protein QTO34_004458 [Cnephaeus nilssonii]|uniref:Gag-Pol polyprotein n=1 Tax=Cnephaeus nilssonii TaxID=3371016 RepID=A0AA40HQA1_CNENI|nr:hypothetical protein QTO34_004458 [Eptesicus nilssonii]
MLKVEGRPVNFLVDTGAQFSVLKSPLGKLSGKTSVVQGATGHKKYSWTTTRSINLGKGEVTHSFLVIPECPAPLLGRDLLTKLGARIAFTPMGPSTELGPPLVLTLRLEDEHRLFEKPREEATDMTRWMRDFPGAWAETAGAGEAKLQPPVVIELKSTATPVAIRQYPMTREARDGIQPHIARLLQLGVLVQCQSPWNTPLLPVKKPGTNDYRPVQDLREVNKRVQDIHPTVPNPYNLLSSIPPDRTWYTVLDLKDAFFCLKLHPDSQKLFAFEWKNPDTGSSGQLTWTRLPQGFKNSPTIFDEALHKDLAAYRARNPQVTLLQYVDDLLLAGATQEDCLTGTKGLLSELAVLGYRASAKKAQICQRKVTYLGYVLEGGQRWLTEGRMATVMQIPVPTTPRQVREFLGTAGFCRLWIPGFATLAEPLYPLTKQGQPFHWGEEQQKAFQEIKKALLSAPALSLPNVEKPFTLYIDEKRGIARGVLTQTLGPWRRPVAYLSKRLDSVARGWPACLRAIAATALLVKDADKLTLGQKLTIIAPHALESIIRQPPDRWMSNARITHYQSLLLNEERVTFGTPAALNPATLLPEVEEGREILHPCLEVLAEETGVRRDLQDTPLAMADHTWFTDGSSYLSDGQRKAGAAVVDLQKTIWASSLPEGTSAQKAELIALTKALQMAKGKRVNIYTDSRYAFATAHVHGAIYQQRGLLTSAGKEIKNKTEILELLEAVLQPKQLAIIHCPGHQKGKSEIAEGNRRADLAAREAALKPSILPLSAWPIRTPRPSFLQYSKEEEEKFSARPDLYKLKQGVWTTWAEGKPIVPRDAATEYLTQLHRFTHLGEKSLRKICSNTGYHFQGLTKTLENVVRGCQACQLVNAKASATPEGKRERGDRPGVHWEIDFTEVKPAKYRYKYLLVFVDTFSGWVEAFPTRHETATVVAKKILEDIFPRFGLPKVIGSDNGPAFVAQVSQGLARVLGINWKLHCAYHPQSSGQVERMNRTLKETMTKLSIETGFSDWTALLPYALFRARNTPNSVGLTPFELLFGAPPPLAVDPWSDVSQLHAPQSLLARLKALEILQKEVWAPLAEAYKPGELGVPHQFQVGDSVYVRRHRAASLEPRWKGPYIVLLTTPTAVRVDGVPAWVHASHVKRAPGDEQNDWTAEKTDNPLKLRILRRTPSPAPKTDK